MSRTQRERRATTHAARTAAKREAREAARTEREEQARLQAELAQYGATVALRSVGERLGIPAERLDEFAQSVLDEPPASETGFWAADIVLTALNVRDRILAAPAPLLNGRVGPITIDTDALSRPTDIDGTDLPDTDPANIIRGAE